jgi:hypothetical protein
MLRSRYTDLLLDFGSMRRIRWGVEKMTKEKHPRKTRSDKGQPKLSARDFACLRWIGEQYGVRLDQLQLLLGRYTRPEEGQKHGAPLTETAARKVVARWVRYEMAGVWNMILGRPPWIYLTRKGLRELGFSYAYWQPDFDKVRHPFLVNDVRLYVERPGGRGRWISERAIRREHRHALRIGGHVHYVDGEIERVDAEGETFLIGIEVERTPKKPSDLQEIVVSLVQSEIYEVVQYFTNTATQPLVERVLSGLPPSIQEKVEISNLEEIHAYRRQYLLAQKGGSK